MAGTFESTNSRKRRKLSSLTNFRFRRKIFIKRLNNAVTAAKSVLSLISKCIYKVFYVCHHIPGPCQPTEEKQCVRLIAIKSEIFLIISKPTACLVVQYVNLCFKAVIIIVNLIKINKCPLYQRFIFSFITFHIYMSTNILMTDFQKE